MANNVALPKGHKFHDYKIAKRLSIGGFSIVYLAYDGFGRPVALKEFFPNNLHLRKKGLRVDFINAREKLRFNEGLKAFKEETEIVMRMKHKSIIEIIDFFEDNGTAYIVMPYEYGMTLSRYVSLEKKQNEADIISIAADVFSAINLFHKNNIIHLDLKPGNIWLRPNKEALILDFGTARVVDDPIKSQMPPMHTPGYAAPEQHRECFLPARVGPWTDYYGLGTTLYALIKKQTPPPANELFEKKEGISMKSEKRGEFSEPLLSIVETLTQLDWEKRKKVVLEEVIHDLKKIRPMPERKSFFDLLRADSLEIFKKSLEDAES